MPLLTGPSAHVRMCVRARWDPSGEASMHYLVTGHTGFKGAWLTLMLTEQGHTVSGLALQPAPGSLYERARLSELLLRDLRVDIRDGAATQEAITAVEPEVVLHLAAQPLVRESYKNPRFTYETNTLGSLNVLEAVEHTCLLYPSDAADAL